MGKETLDWNAFGNMKNLKVLIIRNFGISGGPNCFPESLRVLKWDGYPSNCFPSNFDPNKLLICKLAFGRFTSFKFPDSSKASYGIYSSSCKFMEIRTKVSIASYNFIIFLIVLKFLLPHATSLLYYSEVTVVKYDFSMNIF